MKMLGSLLSFVAVASVSGSVLTGCVFGCDPGNNSQRAAVDFTPASADAVRSCDTFSLDLVGSTNVMKIDIGNGAVLHDGVPLTVNGDTASSTDGTIQFSLSSSASLEGYPLSSATITVTALPATDGDPLSAEVYLTFEDGRVLDQVYSAPVQTVACK